MPISIAELAKKTRSITIDFEDGDDLNVTYRPSVYTAEFESKVTKAMREDAPLAFASAVCELVSDWDLFEDAAQKHKVPLTPERVRTLPVMVLGRVAQAVGDDMRPPSRRGTGSGDGSLV